MSIAKLFAIMAVAAAAPFAANAGTFKTLYAFTGAADGEYPQGPLIYRSGDIYGTAGEAGNNGDVFKVDAKTGHFKIVYSFQGGTDGSLPVSGVIFQSGMLYGTTAFGGNGCSGGCGTIFSIDLKTGSESVLYSFTQAPIGPASLTFVAGTIYGTTMFGGANGAGSVFSINPSTNSFTTLYNFEGASGINPNPQLLYKNGLLYGSTMFGGSGCVRFNGCGTIFTIDPTTGSESVLHTFASRAHGAIPYSNLAYDSGGLIGDTQIGGSQTCKKGCGVSFKMKATTGRETVLEDFDSGDQLYTGLTIMDGRAYETLPSGSGGHGELDQFNLKTRQQATLYTFTGNDGDSPKEPLIYHDGAFYGSTLEGGNRNCFDGCGTIFKFVP